MSNNDVKKRIEKLKDLINYHRYLYHVEDRQEISDAALDSLKKELFDLEQEFPQFITSDSPTQRIGGKPLDKFKKVNHIKPMLSFSDAFSQKDMSDWQARFERLLKEDDKEKIDFYCELKIDGLAIELVYKASVLAIGATRGDGYIGEDITQNLKTIEAIPLSLNRKEVIIEKLEEQKARRKIIESVKKFDFRNDIVIRGEAFISKKEFENVNNERALSGLAPYSNPRNLAAGSIRQLDPKITAMRNLDSFAYDLVTDFSCETHKEKHMILSAMGLKTNKNDKHAKNLDEVFYFYNECEKLRKKIYYEIDGVVVMVNNNIIFENLGVAGKSPRGAVAYKFPTKEATTKIEDIKVQVGRTGALTPVAYLKPVEISGVIVSRATLHNADEIKRLDVKIGDTVIVGRAGDVIPDIIKTLKELRTGSEKDFSMPKFCPVCGSAVEKKENEVNYYCSNSKCLAQQKEFFYHFVSRGAFDMRGLGPKILDRLIEEGLARDPADLFKLKEGDIIPLERFADKSAKNLIESINENKKITLAKFIYSLSIRNVGEKTAEDLAKNFNDINEIEKANNYDFEKIKDIGPVVSASVINWFKNKKNIQLIKKLKNAGIKIYNYKSKSQKLSEKIFVITGTLKSMGRNDAKEKIKQLGGEISESISSNTSYLVAGENPGSKFLKAKKIGVKIISEKEFLELIK